MSREIELRDIEQGGTKITHRHTPLPWRSAPAPTSSGDCRWIYGADRELPVACIPWQMEQPARLANAELIVRAVNCHDELLTACKMFMHEWDNTLNEDFAESPLGAVADYCRKAIIRAESEAK